MNLEFMEIGYKSEVRDKLDYLLQGRSRLKLLEAGCGAFSHIHLGPFETSVGIDSSREQLERNTDLQQKILGDIQTYPLPEEAYDVVVCWYVLEHLSNPQEALRKMLKAVKPGGFLVLTFPNLMSVKGLATKLTPHWFHRLIYWLLRFNSRIFPTYLRCAILPSRVIDYSQGHGFSVAFGQLFEDEVTTRMKQRFWLVRTAFAGVNIVAQALSFGKVKSLHLDNCELILLKHKKL